MRILNAKSVIPDGAVFVPEKSLQKLSLAAESAFKKLKRSALTGSAARGEVSFACQSTPSVKLPRTSGFQFASSFWEDKKPVHNMLDDAYRQNRMSTAAAVRHLHSLHVKAPVFGLVWSDGSVRAHVDWCVNKGQEPPVCTMSTFLKKRSQLSSSSVVQQIVRSAMFPGPRGDNGRGEGNDAHEWNLEKPAHIIQVFLLIKNIDHWTVNEFLKCVEVGITDLVDSVFVKGCPYQPWKRVGKFKSPATKDARATDISISQPSAQPTIPLRRRRVRKS